MVVYTSSLLLYFLIVRKPLKKDLIQRLKKSDKSMESMKMVEGVKLLKFQYLCLCCSKINYSTEEAVKFLLLRSLINSW